MSNRLKVARRAGDAGANIALNSFRTAVDVDTKSSKMDYVTTADIAAQRRIFDIIESEYPNDQIVAEEEDAPTAIPADSDSWVVDPIDGTTNFVHGTRIWATSVAAIQNGQPVAAVTYAPALNDGYWAGTEGMFRNGEEVTVSEMADPDAFTVAPILRYGSDRDEEFGNLMRDLIIRFGDLRRFGCAQVTLGMVASGELDATVSTQPHPNPWDTIAGVHLVEAAGGTVTDLNGDPWDSDSVGIVASNGNVHDEVVNLVRAVISH